MADFDVVEAGIDDLRRALDAGAVTSVQLLEAYLGRIAAYDRAGPTLNALVVMNDAALIEAHASDQRRARGDLLGPLDGIPYTAKDSYAVQGLTCAAGSPAFEHLVAQRDAFAIGRLRTSGAICLGLTNMPPMANGGMQRGRYGRAESPYNGAYLTAAFASGSSNGSGTATAASFAAFGLGEETWSSGRSPASNNALVAYTPSRGAISMRGNWPLVPTMDVVVPHTRTVADLAEVLDVIVADDPYPRGDFWRTQPWIPLPRASALRPRSFRSLLPANRTDAVESLRGRRFGLPRMYINADPEAGTGRQPGIGGPTGQRIVTRPSVIDLVAAARADLVQAGATVIEVDFPAVSNYEGDRAGAPNIRTRGLITGEYLNREILDLSAWAWQDFLTANADPALQDLAQIDGSRIFPQPPGALPDRYVGDFGDDIAAYPDFIRTHPDLSLPEIPTLGAGLAGLVRTRQMDFDEWLAAGRLDAVVFPAAADVGRADADMNRDSADQAWRNGVWVSNGNLVLRHLGIPTVTVPLGIMTDIGVPVGLTFGGLPYHDNELIRLAAAFESLATRRTPPPRTPPL